MSFHRCERCSGAGWICGCGRSHPPPGHFRNKACKRCGSRARPTRCPGIVAGTLKPPLTLFRSDVGEVATATVPHFEAFVDCDCCGIAWVGSYKPSNWPHVKRLGKDIILCHDCAAHHELLVSMALEQLFIDRERANVGKTHC